jgi:Asp-tRNA(Asn)/Glu-tRNA(Gln) amidotransferase A subunit family amidase
VTTVALAGCPHVTVPMGCVEHLLVGLSVFADACADHQVIRIAHAIKSITGHRHLADAGA